MNLERIYVKKGYFVLSKISELSNQYVCIDVSLDSQKTNTGDSIKAMVVKNVEQLKGTRPFKIKTEEEIFDDLIISGWRDNDDGFKIGLGFLVKFNLSKYVVIGIVVNNYAQWNIPTPFLFNTFDVIGDYKALFNSRFSDEEINSKINDNFQSGKYDGQMTIPLVDVNKKSDEISVVEKNPSDTEVNNLIGRFKAEKNSVLTAQKDVFIDTVMGSRSKEIDTLRAESPELYKSVQEMLLSVNKSINNKISGVKEVKTIPVEVAEAVVEVAEAEADDLSFLDDIDGVLDLSFLDDIDNLV